MQLFKSTKFLLKKDLVVKGYFSTANPFSSSLEQNQHQNSLRFENQNRLWTFSELDTHSNAFAYGLIEMGYKKGDKLLLWVEKSNNSEIVGAQIGAGKAGVTLVPTYAKTTQELEQAIKTSNCTGILYSPNSASSTENQKYSDLMQTVVPQLTNVSNGQLLKSDKFPKLKYVVHTGFYTQPGQYKFRDVLVYASKNFNTLSLPKLDVKAPFMVTDKKTYTISDLVGKTEELRSSHKIENQTVVVTGDAKAPLSFAMGALNSTLYGNYCIYTGNIEVGTELGKTFELLDKSVLVLDGDLAKDVSQLNWENSAKEAVQSVALLDRGNGVKLDGLFSGKEGKSYGFAL